MAKRKRDRLPFEPDAFIDEPRLKTCSIEAFGVWMVMLCVMHSGQPYGYLTTPEGVPVDAAAIAAIMNRGRQPVHAIPVHRVEVAVAELIHAGVPSVNDIGVIFNRRMVRDAARRATNAENGKKGGNRALIGGRFSLVSMQPKTVVQPAFVERSPDTISDNRNDKVGYPNDEVRITEPVSDNRDERFGYPNEDIRLTELAISDNRNVRITETTKSDNRNAQMPVVTTLFEHSLQAVSALPEFGNNIEKEALDSSSGGKEGAGEKGVAKKRRRAEVDGVRIPLPFEVTEHMRLEAKAISRERTPEHVASDAFLDWQTRKFVNYWKARTGGAGRKLDWEATWINWMMSAFEKREHVNFRPAPQQQPAEAAPQTSGRFSAEALAKRSRRIDDDEDGGDDEQE